MGRMTSEMYEMENKHVWNHQSQSVFLRLILQKKVRAILPAIFTAYGSVSKPYTPVVHIKIAA